MRQIVASVGTFAFERISLAAAITTIKEIDAYEYKEHGGYASATSGQGDMVWEVLDGIKCTN
ncbi:hypothetical protein ACFOQM_06330 [Paenibacillus sp. GCM10012307]|uniref:Uncharacterized protein n=1 Tax=Paenibacillus roseus TaxID=2798579 RepID=A0A934IX52_9BACL|nr:hypothetical protein [Paenibacillus roseus]